MRLAVATLALLIFAAPAHARYHGAVPEPENVTVHYAPCPVDPDAAGCGSASERVIYVDRRRDRWTLAHELGHIWLDNLGPYWQGALIDRLDLDGLDWNANADDCWGRPCPAEIAADVYAACALRLDPRPRRIGKAIANPQGWHTAYDYWPTRRHHRRLCSVINRSAHDPLRR